MWSIHCYTASENSDSPFMTHMTTHLKKIGKIVEKIQLPEGKRQTLEKQTSRPPGTRWSMQSYILTYTWEKHWQLWIRSGRNFHFCVRSIPQLSERKPVLTSSLTAIKIGAECFCEIFRSDSKFLKWNNQFRLELGMWHEWQICYLCGEEKKEKETNPDKIKRSLVFSREQ